MPRAFCQVKESTLSDSLPDFGRWDSGLFRGDPVAGCQPLFTHIITLIPTGGDEAMKRILLAISLLQLASSTAFGGQTAAGSLILPRFKAGVVLSLSDQVSGGCLPRPTGLQNAFEVELRRLGFEIAQEVGRNVDSTIHVVPLGFELNAVNGCVIALKFSVETLWPAWYPEGELDVFCQPAAKFMAIEVWSDRTLITAANGNEMQSSLQDYAREIVNAFYLDVMRAQTTTGNLKPRRAEPGLGARGNTV